MKGNPVTDQSNETIEIPDDLSEMPEAAEPQPYRTLLELWKVLLASSRNMIDEPVSPQWATKIVQTYPEIRFKDAEDVHVGVFAMTAALADILDRIIAEDDECLNKLDAQEDAEQNAVNYRRVLTDWQVYFVEQEAAWRATDKAAAVKLAVLSEVQQMFFGQTGLVNHLDSIGFQYTEADQQALTETLVAAKAAVQGKEVGGE